jgi:hypothetical protein
MEGHIRVSLDPVRAAKLTQLAGRADASETELASSLLAAAIDQTDPSPAEVAQLLDGIDGAHERALLGLQQARSQNSIGVEEL